MSCPSIEEEPVSSPPILEDEGSVFVQPELPKKRPRQKRRRQVKMKPVDEDEDEAPPKLERQDVAGYGAGSEQLQIKSEVLKSTNSDEIQSAGEPQDPCEIPEVERQEVRMQNMYLAQLAAAIDGSSTLPLPRVLFPEGPGNQPAHMQTLADMLRKEIQMRPRNK